MMKLKKKTETLGQEPKQEETKHEALSRQGRNAKRKGGQFERDIAKKFQNKYGVELKRTPQSGGFAKKSDKADDYRGDITIVDTKQMLLLHIECKNQKQWSLPKWIRQAESDCPEGRVPIVVFHEHNTSNDYITLKLEDFLNLVPKEKVVGRRTFKK
nr:MAG TPA: HOLLIDAY JUNCTION RESOLVASE HOMOLOGOUS RECOMBINATION [Caudoviricetes sp.]